MDTPDEIIFLAAMAVRDGTMRRLSLDMGLAPPAGAVHAVTGVVYAASQPVPGTDEFDESGTAMDGDTTAEPSVDDSGTATSHTPIAAPAHHTCPSHHRPSLPRTATAPSPVVAPSALIDDVAHDAPAMSGEVPLAVISPTLAAAIDVPTADEPTAAPAVVEPTVAQPSDVPNYFFNAFLGLQVSSSSTSRRAY